MLKLLHALASWRGPKMAPALTPGDRAMVAREVQALIEYRPARW
jgi:hypothetical protein